MCRPLSLVLVLALAGSAAAVTIHVSPGGPLTIEQAILQAADGDTVALADGIYTGAGNRDLQLHGKASTVRSQSGDPAACILDVQGSAADQHRGFYLVGAEGLDTVIEGLTITGGWHGGGGGMNCEEGYPTVRNCRFIANQAPGGGGFRTSGPSRVVDCWFSDNLATGGGGAAVENSFGAVAVFERCTFTNNQGLSWGGGFRS